MARATSPTTPGTAGGEYDLATALSVSSDSYFYNLGELFWEGRATYGDNAIQNVGAQYGEGVSTGIDLPNEVVGRVDSQTGTEKLHEENPTAFPNTLWYTGDNVEMAFGQGATALTPIEQAVAYATFANGGTRYAPEVASEIVDPTTGKVVTQFTPKVLGHVNLPASVSTPILQGLEGVIANKMGTAYGVFQGFPANWNLAGKTGTATNPGAKEPNSWFVAFGPNPNPQYVVLAVIDEGGYGAEAAAPLVRNDLQLHRGESDRRREDADREDPPDVHRAGEQRSVRHGHHDHHDDHHADHHADLDARRHPETPTSNVRRHDHYDDDLAVGGLGVP